VDLTIAEVALKDRVCDATDRIPTNRWPFFSQTIETTTADAQVDPIELTLEADRDLLLTTLSILVIDTVTGLALDALVDIEYCDTVWNRNNRVSQWRYCCDRKPVFLAGIKENKKLKFTITLEITPSVNPVHVEVTVSGMQGNGCCS